MVMMHGGVVMIRHGGGDGDGPMPQAGRRHCPCVLTHEQEQGRDRYPAGLSPHRWTPAFTWMPEW
jgi:hypothetical protein